MDHGFHTHKKSTDMHFFKVLMDDFRIHLSIPQKFVSTFKGELSETVVLRGPNGNTWRVGLKWIEEKLYFEDGWPKLVHDNGLQMTDFLVFRCAEDSTFDFLTFDCRGCEKECSQFVQTSGVLNSNNGCKKEKVLDESEDTKKGPTFSMKAKRGGRTKTRSRTTFHDSVQFEGNMKSEPRSGDSSTHTEIKPRHTKINMKDISSDTDPCDADADSSDSEGSSRNALPSYVDKAQKYPYYFLSSRRAVTESEKYAALLKAEAVNSTKPGFIHVMKQSNVYKGFRLAIPFNWARIYLPRKSQNVILRVSGRTWFAELKFRKLGTGLEKGWNMFVMENNLEEGDACLFELSQGGENSDDTIIIDVSIFRVVEEILPLTKFIRPRT